MRFAFVSTACLPIKIKKVILILCQPPNLHQVKLHYQGHSILAMYETRTYRLECYVSSFVKQWYFWSRQLTLSACESILCELKI